VRQPPPQWTKASSFTMFLDHTQRRNTVCRTPLDEWSARQSRDLYLTTQLVKFKFFLCVLLLVLSGIVRNCCLFGRVYCCGYLMCIVVLRVQCCFFCTLDAGMHMTTLGLEWDAGRQELAAKLLHIYRIRVQNNRRREFKRDMQSSYNVTLRSVCAAIAGVEKQYLLHIVSVYL
jgi:hypothetical protein